MSDESYCIYRPEIGSFPDIGLPVYPRSSGCFIRQDQEYEYVQSGKKNFVQLFWSVEGEAEFDIAGKASLLKPGHVVYRLPMQEHRILPISKLWKYYWIAFDGKNAQDFMLSYGYPAECFYAGDCPVANFLNFKSLMQLRSPFAWRQMFAELVAILAKAGGGANDDSYEGRIVSRIIAICNTRFPEVSLNVNQIARELDVCRTTLLNIFKKGMKQSISEYLSKVRLQHALFLLKNTFEQLSEISRQCGFSDVNYFCRFIKKHTGKRPTQFRR